MNKFTLKTGNGGCKVSVGFYIFSLLFLAFIHIRIATAQVVPAPGPENSVPLYNYTDEAERLWSSINLPEFRKELALEAGMYPSDTALFFKYVAETEIDEVINFFGRAKKGQINASNINSYKEELKHVYTELYESFDKIKPTLVAAAAASPETDKIQVINGPCVNMGFELKNFTGWEGAVGIHGTPTTANDPVNAVNGFAQHCIMTAGMVDPLVPKLPVVYPGTQTSLRLGNTVPGGHAVRIRQTFLVDSTNMIFTYRYAVVLEDPTSSSSGGQAHTPQQRPYFRARVLDKNGNEIKCGVYTAIVKPGLSGYTRACVTANHPQASTNYGCPVGTLNYDGSPINTETNINYPTDTVTPCAASTGGGGTGGGGGGGGGGTNQVMDIYYKDWTNISIPLTNYLGQNLTIEFIAADCQPKGHLGYAYVQAKCAPLSIGPGVTVCSGREQKVLKGADGFSTYSWSGPGIVSGTPTNQQSITVNKSGKYIMTVVPESDQPCPTDITYIVNEYCPPTGFSDTLCETVSGSGIAQNILLSNYSSVITAAIPGSTINSWHTAKPASPANLVSTTSVSAKNKQTYYVIRTYTGGSDTVNMTFYINSNPVITFPALPTQCMGNPGYQISGVTPAGGTFTGTNVTSTGLFSSIAAGTFSITYHFTTPAGCTDSSAKPIIVIPKPLVNAGPDQQLCSNTPSFVLNGSIQNSTSPLWKGGTGSFTPGNTALTGTYTPSTSEITSGKVTLTLLNTDSLVCPASHDQVTLIFEKKPVVDAGPDQTFCTKAPVATLAGTFSNAKGILWSGGTGKFASATNPLTNYTPTASEISAGQTTLQIVSTGSVLCSADTDVMQILFKPFPQVNAGPDQTVCADAPNVTLNGQVLVTGFGATWSNGVGNFVNGKTTLNTPYNPASGEIQSGKVDLILTSINNGSCPPAADTMRINIIPLPIIDLGPDIVNCVGTPEQIQVASLPSVTYSWYKDAVAIAGTGNSQSLQISGSASKYKVVATDSHGCSSSDSILVSGIPVPTIRVNDTTVCENTSAKLIAHASGTANQQNIKPVFSWTLAGKDLNINDTVVDVSAAGTYIVKVSLGSCNASATGNVYYHALPVLNLPSLVIFCPDTAAGITLDAGPGYSKYLWLPNFETTEKILASSAGTYKVTVTNQYNCSSDDAVEVKEICPPRLFISNSFSPNTDGRNDYYNVYGAHFTNFRMLIYNRWGEVIFESKDRHKVWDGYYHGEQMTIGVYPWIITYEGDTEQYRGPYKMEGSVTVVR